LTLSAVSASRTHALMSRTVAHSVLIGTGTPTSVAAIAHLSCSLNFSAQTARCLTTTNANVKTHALISRIVARSVLNGNGTPKPVAATAHLSCSLTLVAQTARCLTTTNANVKTHALISRIVARSVLIGTGITNSVAATAHLSCSLTLFAQTACCLTTKNANAKKISGAPSPKRNVSVTDPTTFLILRYACALAISR
jgi:hypothetical protein